MHERLNMSPKKKRTVRKPTLLFRKGQITENESGGKQEDLKLDNGMDVQ